MEGSLNGNSSMKKTFNMQMVLARDCYFMTSNSNDLHCRVTVFSVDCKGKVYIWHNS